MDAELVDPLEDARWARLVAGAPGALVFHTPAWLRLLRRQYGYELAAWCVRDGDRLVAGLPVARVVSRLTGRRLVAIPFCDLCGPLVQRDAAPEAEAALLRLIAAERARAGLDLEIHEAVAGLDGAQPSQRFWHHAVPLSRDVEAVEAAFTKSQVKRGARKARKEGLGLERRTDAAALDAFYGLHLATRRRQGVPIQPRRFIRRFAELFADGLGFVALVGEDGAPPAAAAVFLTFGDTVTYKYGASDPGQLRRRPNNLLFLDVIHWACAEGYEQLDLGRTDLDNEGLREFKLSWGARERDVAYTFLSDGRRAPSRRSGGSRAVQAVLRRSPPVVSRVVGEALYRHFP